MDEAEQRRRDARKPTNRKFKMSFDMAGRYVSASVSVSVSVSVFKRSSIKYK